MPTEWSAEKNIVWKVKLPGAGASCPVTEGKRVFVTCYSGYGMDVKNPSNMEDLRRHLLCLDRATGNTLWAKEFKPDLPEHKYAGEGAYHGYAASTPIIEGDRLYVFFGKSGVYCFDLDGKELWHVLVGKRTNGWGSGASPILYKDSLIINASVESGDLVALNKKTGEELWRSKGISSCLEHAGPGDDAGEDPGTRRQHLRLGGCGRSGFGQGIVACQGRASLRLPQRRGARRRRLCHRRRQHVAGGQSRR